MARSLYCELNKRFEFELRRQVGFDSKILKRDPIRRVYADIHVQATWESYATLHADLIDSPWDRRCAIFIIDMKHSAEYRALRKTIFLKKPAR